MALPVVKVLVVANQFTKDDLRLLSSILNNKKGFGQVARFHVICDKNRYYLGETPETGTASILVAGKFRSDQIRHVFPTWSCHSFPNSTAQTVSMAGRD